MRRAYLYTLLIVVCWGIGPPTNKALLLARGPGAQLSPLQVAFWAIVVGWVALLALMVARDRVRRFGDLAPRGWLVLAAMGFFGWSSYPVALNFAFVRMPLPDALLINYLHPVFVVVFQGTVFGAIVRPITGWEQRPDYQRRPAPARLALALGLCLLGVAIIATNGQLTSLAGIRSAWGALAALYAAFAWGVYSNLGRFVPVRPGRDARGLSDVHAFLSMTFGLAMLAAILTLTHQVRSASGLSASFYLGPSGPVHLPAWWLIAVLGLGVYCGSYTLWLYALELGGRFGEAHKLPPLTYLAPAVAVTLGWLMLHEPFGPAFWTGAALIVAGNAANVWRPAGVGLSPSRERS